MSALPFPTGRPSLVFGEQGRELDTLLAFGGFPEPCIAARARTLKRRQKERFERVFREDIRETEIVRALAQVELLGSLIPGRVGSLLSIRNLAEDVEASPKTIKSWIELLARNYYLFRVSPKRSQDTVRCGGGVIAPLPANCCSCGSFIDGPISQKIGVAHPAVVRSFEASSEIFRETEIVHSLA